MYSTVLQDIENDQKIVLKKERALVSCPTYKNGECVQSDAVFEFAVFALSGYSFSASTGSSLEWPLWQRRWWV